MYPWSRAGVFQLRNLVHSVTRKLFSFEELHNKFEIPKKRFFSYLQIKLFFFCSKSSSLSLEKPTACKLLCAQGPCQPGLISSIYKILHESTPLRDVSHTYMQKWSKIIQTPLSLPQWQRIWDSISKASRCMEQRDTAYKILLFWYRTPEVLYTYDLPDLLEIP